MWDLEFYSEKFSFEGHSHAVCVLAIKDLDYIVTGS